MGAFENAVNAVADFPKLYVLTAPTVKYAYRMDAIPDKLTRDKLPCAVCWGGMLNGGKLESLTFNNTSLTTEFDVEQHIYFAPESISPAKVLPIINRFWDNYITAITANPYYGPATAPAMHGVLSIVPELQFVVVGDFKYHTLVLTHKLKVML